MSATQYDVFINLKTSRDNAKTLGGATKGLRQALAQAERDQQRMRKAEAARHKAAERDAVKTLASQQRAAKAEERDQRRAQARERAIVRDRLRADSVLRRHNRAALAEEAKAAAQRKAWVRDLASAGSKRAGAVGGAVGGAGNFFSNIGTGGAAAWAMQAGAVITGILAGAVAAGLGKVGSGGFEDNVKAETFVGSTATTLQLYGFNQGTGDGSDKAQFAENLDNARWYQQELQRIADASPGDITQVTELFEGAIPGMAGITQDAKRITDLTQKVTYLAGTIGDFQMVGAQTGQILQGGAGSEFKTWLRIQEPIRKAGIEMKLFKKEQKGGAKLTEAFNKLDPASRLKLFEKGLEALGPEVAAYFETTFDGITSQSKSSLIILRKELGKGMFDATKERLKLLTGDSGALNRDGPAFAKMQGFMSFLGKQMGSAISKSIDIAEKVFVYTANNWQTIVMRAQQAGHYLVTGAKLAATLMAVRTGVGAAAGLGGAGIGIMSGVASAATSIVSMGLAAAVVAPMLIGMGIVFAGAGVLVGGAVAYIVSNLDNLVEEFWDWTTSADSGIQPFLNAIDTLVAQFVALGGYIFGAGEDTDIFTTITKAATTAVETAGTAFWGLIDVTADVIVAFASAAEELVRLGRYFGLLNGTTQTDLDNAKEKYNEYVVEQGMFESDAAFEKRFDETINSPEAQAARTNLENVERSYRNDQPGLVNKAQGVATFLHGAADAARNGKADPREWTPTDYLFAKMNPIGPPEPPKNANGKTPPKVNVKQTNYHTWNVRDTDPNAIVAGFNKVNAQKAAQPIKSALAAVRRR